MQEKKHFLKKLLFLTFFLGLVFGVSTRITANVEKESIEIFAVVMDKTQSIYKDEKLTENSRTIIKDQSINNISGFVDNVQKTSSRNSNVKLFFSVLRLDNKEDYGVPKIEYTKLGMLDRLEGGRLTQQFLSFKLALNKSFILTEEGQLRIMFSENAMSILKRLYDFGTDVKFKITNKTRNKILYFEASELYKGTIQKDADFTIGEPIELSLAPPDDIIQYKFVNPYELFIHKNSVLGESTVEAAGEIKGQITIYEYQLPDKKYGYSNKFPISCNFPILLNLQKLEIIDANDVTITPTNTGNTDPREGKIWVAFESKAELDRFIDRFRRQGKKYLDFKATFVLDNKKKIKGDLTVEIPYMRMGNDVSSLLLYIAIAVFILPFVIFGTLRWVRWLGREKLEKQKRREQEKLDKAERIKEEDEDEGEKRREEEKGKKETKEDQIEFPDMFKRYFQKNPDMKVVFEKTIEKFIRQVLESSYLDDFYTKRLQDIFDQLVSKSGNRESLQSSKQLAEKIIKVSEEVQNIKNNILPQITREVPELKNKYESLINTEQKRLEERITQWLKKPHTDEEFNNLFVDLKIVPPKSMNIQTNIKLFCGNAVKAFVVKVQNLILELESCCKTFSEFDNFFEKNSVLIHQIHKMDWSTTFKECRELDLLECLHQCLLLLKSKKIVVYADSLHSFKERIEDRDPMIVNAALSEWLLTSYLEGHLDHFFILHQLLENGFTREISHVRQNRSYMELLNDLNEKMNKLQEVLKNFSIFPLIVKIYNTTLSDLTNRGITKYENFNAHIEDVRDAPYVENTPNGTVVRIVRMRYAKNEQGKDPWTTKEGKFRVYKRN